MGSYNWLAATRVTPCGRCASVQEVQLQFHHGHRDLSRYEIGDLLAYDEGVDPEDETEIWGYVASCEQCGFIEPDDRDDLYVIRIERGRLVSARRPALDDFTRIGPY